MPCVNWVLLNEQCAISMWLLPTYYMMPTRTQRRQPAKYPVTAARMSAEELDVVDAAAALRDESRSAYIARVAIREARADLREAERKAQSASEVAA